MRVRVDVKALSKELEAAEARGRAWGVAAMLRTANEIRRGELATPAEIATTLENLADRRIT